MGSEMCIRDSNKWWYGRSIPASRQGIQQALAILRIGSTQELIDKSYGLSLSDQYWIKEKGSSLEWAEINFFTNDFSRDIGDILGHSEVWARVRFYRGKEKLVKIIGGDNNA